MAEAISRWLRTAMTRGAQWTEEGSASTRRYAIREGKEARRTLCDAMPEGKEAREQGHFI